MTMIPTTVIFEKTCNNVSVFIVGVDGVEVVWNENVNIILADVYDGVENILDGYVIPYISEDGNINYRSLIVATKGQFEVQRKRASIIISFVSVIPVCLIASVCIFPVMLRSTMEQTE